jgi:hypothetical protein
MFADRPPGLRTGKFYYWDADGRCIWKVFVDQVALGLTVLSLMKGRQT